MFYFVVLMNNDDYPGFLSFLSEELLNNVNIEGFHVRRYQTARDEENNHVHVQLDIHGEQEGFKQYLTQRLDKLKSTGLIVDIDPFGWRLDKRMFGDKGSKLAEGIFDLSTEFAIKTREKFGRLLDPQNEFPDEIMNRFIAPGMWLLFSSFCNSIGYTSIQEINTYLQAIQTRLQLMKKAEGEKIKQILKLMVDMF